VTIYDSHMTGMERRTGSAPSLYCSIERTLAVVGEKWTFLVLREAFTGVRRFADLQAGTGAPRQVLSARLGRLVEEGLMRKVPYREPGQRQRDEYRLTQKGLELYPIMIALMHWGDRYVAPPEGPSVIVTHRGCGAPIEQYFRCAKGHHVGGPREATPIPGPGAPRPDDEAPDGVPTLEACTGSC
jgi:Predicted transcriptional regulators